MTTNDTAVDRARTRRLVGWLTATAVLTAGLIVFQMTAADAPEEAKEDTSRTTVAPADGTVPVETEPTGKAGEVK
ncbi:hypothetical protein BJF78_12175 [Pseudonocardia sp. CNS-139]|nr:hypothetical protein BJF78_12175 [Pseudonocardia sp. CNS-139]